MAGIYLHIPFCKQRCTYCDFHFSTQFKSYQSRMVHAICKELVERKNETKEIIQTIYFGGGTPSLLEAEELQEILQTIQREYQVDPLAEITLEANPDDIVPDKLKSWNEAKVNRLSIGLQSFRAEDLAWMNRAHTAEESLRCVAWAKEAGIHQISVDLIYGLPQFSIEAWDQQIQTVIDMGVQHISAYCLTVEEKTLLEKKVEAGEIVPSSSEEQADQFQYLIQKLAQNGYEQYEISNFCLPDNYSKHNTSYWQGKTYLGIGPSAHSFDGKTRRWNLSNNPQYMAKMEKGEQFWEVEHLSEADRFNEKIMVGLRTKWGVSLHDLRVIHEIPASFSQKVKEYSDKGWVCLQSDTITLTPEGKLLADWLASEFFL